jgi:hypothetical protein
MFENVFINLKIALVIDDKTTHFFDILLIRAIERLLGIGLLLYLSSLTLALEAALFNH